MKILVLSNIRCGGEYFTKSLAYTYNLKHIHEPDVISNFGNDVCVKIYLHGLISVDDVIVHSRLYDYVFLLDRKDKKEQVKSAYTMYNITNHRTSNWTWNDEYLEIKNPVADISYLENYVSLIHNKLVKISNSLNKEIIYYEDLYHNTDSVDLNGLEFKPDLSKRYYVENGDKNKLI